MTKDSIIRKIVALQERTVAQGCSEAEALSAARLVGRLLAQHNLAMTDVQLRSSSCTQGTVETFSHSEVEICFCITSIGRFYDVKCWHSVDPLGGHQYHFFGLQEDVRVAKWLYEIIFVAMGRELVGFRLYMKQKKIRAGKKQISSFLSGMAGKIGRRLVEMKREQDAKNKTTTGRDLVILKSDIVREQFETLGIGLHRRHEDRKPFDGDAFNSGDRTGGRVNFNKTIEGS